MNIQIFGTKKSFDSKKAERYFKERGIKYQFVDEYYGSNVPLFRRNGYRQSGTMIP